MNGPSLFQVAMAEWIKLTSRGLVRLSGMLLVVLSLVIPSTMAACSNAIEYERVVHTETTKADGTVEKTSKVEVREAGTPSGWTTADVLWWTLAARNLFVVRMLLIAIIAVSVAGEFTRRTAREELLRPLSRSRWLLGKWIAFQGLVVVSVLIPAVVAFPLGLMCFGGLDDMGTAVARYALTAVGDVGFTTLVMAIAIVARSVPGTIAGFALYWVLDRVAGWVLIAGQAMRKTLEVGGTEPWWMPILDTGIIVRPMLPSAAFNLYQEFDSPAGIPTLTVVAWIVLTVVAYAVADRVLDRADVP